MADKDRGQAPTIKQKLLDAGPRFSFVQAYRLLRFITRRTKDKAYMGRDIEKMIRVRPELSLDFPESDINVIDEIADIPPHYLLTVTFLGLYGSSSPLPTFYTEDLFLEQSEDKTIARDFIDVINSPIYHLFFKCWSKYRLFLKLVEEKDTEVLLRLFSLIGLEESKLRDKVENAYGMNRFSGFLTQFPRSAEVLRGLLIDRLNEPSIRIQQCVPRVAEIPEDQRCFVGQSGNVLGKDSYLGTEIDERMGKFRVQAEPLNGEAFHTLLPDRRAFRDMSSMIGYYVDQPLIWDMELFIDSNNIETTRIGHNRWSQLGWNTWVYSEKFHTGNLSVTLSE